MKNTTSIVLLTITLCSCGGSSSGTNEEPALNAALPGPHQATTTDNPYVESTLAFSAQQVTEQANETSQITVAPEFDFRTSRTVPVSMDFPEARGLRANVLICTDYGLEQGAYKVNYDSCLLRAPLLNGYLSEEVAILNRFSKVLGVAWFAEPGSDPLYLEIDLSEI